MIIFKNKNFRLVNRHLLIINFIIFTILGANSCTLRLDNSFIICNNELEINAWKESFYLNSENYLYRIINNNVPSFNLSEYDGKSFEKYSDLDELGRCGPAEALIGEDIMPRVDEKRSNIGMVKPSGWPTPQKKYDSVEGKYLYNRCHLIGW